MSGPKFRYTDKFGCARALHWWGILFRAQRELNQLGVDDQMIVEQLVPSLSGCTVIYLVEDEDEHPPVVN